MTTPTPTTRTSIPPTSHIRGPAELLQAVPYLLGFHPHQSLVLVGTADGLLVVTARLDLADTCVPGLVVDTVAAIRRGGATAVIGAVYDDDAVRDAVGGDPRLSAAKVADQLDAAGAAAGCRISDVLLVGAGRWWSLSCGSPRCCPLEGTALSEQPSEFAAAATYSGVVALPDRAALQSLLDPVPAADLERVGRLLEAEEHAAVSAILAGGARRHERSVKRRLFAAVRAGQDTPAIPLDDQQVACFGAALGSMALRDAVWTALDAGRLDGRQLWSDLARRLPPPYDAAPLFLCGWSAWRAGNGALAAVAAQRALESDPGYSAADLLLAALSHGVDPRTMPRVRLPRSA